MCKIVLHIYSIYVTFEFCVASELTIDFGILRGTFTIALVIFCTQINCIWAVKLAEAGEMKQNNCLWKLESFPDLTALPSLDSASDSGQNLRRNLCPTIPK